MNWWVHGCCRHLQGNRTLASSADPSIHSVFVLPHPTQAHTHRAELYPHTQPRHLEWPFRLAAVVRHVAELRPDVLCLQVRA